MSGYYDQNLRWEPLAEFHFNVDDDDDEEFCVDNYIYCLCSRVQIRDIVKTYSKQENNATDSDVEDTNDQFHEYEDHSHVHFSLNATQRNKCEKDEVASCYCSASHTENYCSTDEHDPAQSHGLFHHGIQASDSGADLTYHDHFTDHQENIKEEITEDYLTESTWEKFWAVNGERLIWASWIKKYSNYINPAYLNANNDLVMDDNNIPKQHSVDQIFNNEDMDKTESMRERKFSYDSKVNPCKKNPNASNKYENKEDKEGWWPIQRKRSISEHDRMLSPRTILGTDSMTNVTKITLSSDMSSSHVTSNSTPTDDYSVTSSISDEQNDQTKVANINENSEVPLEEMDTEQYWQFLWKKHFGEQYALHYANYIECQNLLINDLPSINVDTVENKIILDNIDELPKENIESKAIEIDSDNEKNKEDSQALSNIQDQVDEINLNKDNENQTVKTKTTKKRNQKRFNSKYLGSVGFLLQNLLKQEQNNTNTHTDEVINNLNYIKERNEIEENECKEESSALIEAGDDNAGKTDNNVSIDVVDSNTDMNNVSSNEQFMQSNSKIPYGIDDDEDEDPPDEKAVELKRSHEEEDEENQEESKEDKIKNTLEAMGFCFNAKQLPKGRLIYRKRFARLRPPRGRRSAAARKTYFDEDGNAYQEANESQEEREMQTDDDAVDCDFQNKPIPNEDINKIESSQNIEIPFKEKLQAETEASIELDYDVQINVEEVDSDFQNKPIPNEDINKLESSQNIEIPLKEKLQAETDASIELDYDVQIDVEEVEERNVTLEAADAPLPLDLDATFSDVQDLDDSALDSGRKLESLESSVARKKIENRKNQRRKTRNNIRAKKFQKAKHNCVNTKKAKLITKEFCKNDVEKLRLSKNPKCQFHKDANCIKRLLFQVFVYKTILCGAYSAPKRKRRTKRARQDDFDATEVPLELVDDAKMLKYWKKRHSLFHRFDDGIKLDRESWFSVTPENVAWHIADKCRYDVIVDAFCGAGGNTIQFAHTCHRVIAIDIDPVKIEMAKHNAQVYGVADHIDFIVGDFFKLAEGLQADMVFLSPPWGGPEYSDNQHYDLETMLVPQPASELMSVAQLISSNVAFYLPRNTRTEQLISMAQTVGGSLEIEQSFLDRRFVAITAYFYQQSA